MSEHLSAIRTAKIADLGESAQIPFEIPPPPPSNLAETSKVVRMEPAGKQSTLDQLVETHLAGTLRFSIRLTGDPDTAEEVVQEALSRAAGSWKTFRGEAEFRTWLFRIVIHSFRDMLRRRQSTQHLRVEPIDDRSTDPMEAAQTAELNRLVAARIAELPPRQREVLVLSAYEGMSAGDIAGVLGITPANVYATLHIARERLRQQLAPYLLEK